MLDRFFDELCARLRAEMVADMRHIVRNELREALDQEHDQLQPLRVILNCSTRAAAARLRRDAGLRQLGIPTGRGRLLFRRADVHTYMRADRPAGKPRLRTIGDQP